MGIGMSPTTNRFIVNAATGEDYSFRNGSRDSLQLYAVLVCTQPDKEVFRYFYDSPEQYESYTNSTVSEEGKARWLQHQVELGFVTEY